MRGSRTCGGGSSKNRRGGGHRGGRGLAGSGKSKKTKLDYVKKNFPDHIGRRGFKRPVKVVVPKEVINVQELDECIDTYVEEGKAKKKGDTFIIDLKVLGISKVLGTGKVTKKLDVSAPSFSKAAVQKIEERGGKVHDSS
jgi:large subunit ribosomal protein L15